MGARACFLLALVVWAVPAFVFAQGAPDDSGEAATMGEVVVTGTRYEERVQKIPANVTVIDENAIKNSNAKNLPNLLRSSEGIVVRDILGNGKAAIVDLRGFGESAPSNTLVLVDGRRVNEIDLSGVDWTQIPIDQVERIEIIRGTGTVLYGDNAVGGVINIITKTPSEKLKASAGGSLGSYNYKNALFSANGGYGRVTASLYGDSQGTDGYRENNEFQAKNLGGKIIFDPSDRLSFNLSGSYHSDDSGLPGPLTADQFSANPRATNFPFDEGKTSDNYLKLGSNLDCGEYGNLVVDLAYRNRDIKSQFVSLSGTFLSDSDIQTWSFTPRYVLNHDIFGRQNNLIGGFDFYGSDQSANSSFGTPPEPSGLAGVREDTYSLYVNDEIALLQNLFLTLGARYENVQYDLSNTPLTGFPVPPTPLTATVGQSEYAYVAGLNYVYSGKSYVFIRANRSFRFPNTDELIEFDQFTGQPKVNSGLQPQTGLHFDLGIRHFFTPAIQANLTFYRAEINNEIYYNPTPAPFIGTNANYPETLHQGIEMGVTADLLKKLTLFGNYTFEDAVFQAGPFDGNEIPGVPRNKLNLGLRIHDVVPGLIFSADYNYVGASYLVSDQANTFPKLDDYYTIDVRVSYTLRWLTAFVGVNNVTGQKYSQYGLVGQYPSGTPEQPLYYPSPDINWIAGIGINL
jgi:iron complex outermembrane receptor protein